VILFKSDFSFTMSAEPKEEDDGKKVQKPTPRTIRRGMNSARKSVVLDPDDSSENDEAENYLDRAEGDELAVTATETHLEKRMRNRAIQGTAQADPITFTETSFDVPKPEMHRGWLQKAAPNWMNQWSDRWFILEDQQLRWYKSPADIQALGMLDFVLVPCEIEQLWIASDQRQSAALQNIGKRECICSPVSALFWDSESEWVRFRICPAGSDRAFELKVRGKDKGADWVSALLSHIRFAESKRFEQCVLQDFGRKWWKVDRISPSRFTEIADTGDIMLFRSKGAFPGVLRAVAGGKYDHVGLVLKLAQGTVALLESTGGDGVGICTWTEFCQNGWHQLYPILAIRRVSFDRTPAKLTALQEWCTQILGKPYSLTIGKLMQRRSVSSGGNSTDEAFFCSQLVAEGLKVLEVLPRGVSSTQFWPSTFSASHKPQIETLQGCSFRQELTIDFCMDSSTAQAIKSGAKQRDETVAWK